MVWVWCASIAGCHCFVVWAYKEKVQNQQIEYSGRTSPTIKKNDVPTLLGAILYYVGLSGMILYKVLVVCKYIYIEIYVYYIYTCTCNHKITNY